jgi:type I site-specific restriction-modification system R (restriction) subunit
MSRLSKAYKVSPDAMRTREFEYHGQSFKVRVPLAKEAEEMFKRADNPPEAEVEEKFQELSKDLYAKKEEIVESGADIKFTDDDVVVGENSLRELAKNQAAGNIRIIESFKLLVTATGENLTDITYEEINEEFPLPVQLALVKKIAEVISPGYEEIRKN